MATMRLVVSLSLMAACYPQEPAFYTTFPEPVVVEGPPGGEIDPAWQAAYADDNAPGSVTGSIDVSVDLSDPANMTASCTDGEIDATLDGYGEWIEIEGYGRVWRPYTTVVGVDFTPYETCGSWVWTDYGWTFACEWDWGWLPFHYGRWGWFDDYWAWQPGYDWSPAWVDWRGGGGYVGWRPQRPIVRDHRGEHTGVVVRDHRSGGPIVRDHRTAKSKDWQWRFAAAKDFGKPRIRSHLYKSPAEALRVTAAVTRAPVHATVQPVRAESIMRSRLATAAHAGARDQRFAPSRVTHSRVAPARVERSTWREERRRQQASAVDAAAPVYQPTFHAPQQPPHENPHGATPLPMHQPREAIAPTSPPPSRGFDRPVQPPASYSPPAPPSRGFERPVQPPASYSPPSRGFERPVQPPASYSPPSRSYDRPSSPPASYSPPSRSYDRPSSPPASYSPPSRSYDSSSSSSSSSPPSRSYDRSSSSSSSSPPSRSYDRSSSSSSSSPPSRSYDRSSSSSSSSSPPSRSYDRSSSSSSSSPPSRSYDRPASAPSSGGGGGARNHRR